MKRIFTQRKRRRRHERPSRRDDGGKGGDRFAARLEAPPAPSATRRRLGGFPDRPVGMTSSRWTGLVSRARVCSHDPLAPPVSPCDTGVPRLMRRAACRGRSSCTHGRFELLDAEAELAGESRNGLAGRLLGEARRVE
jgi:hypothetical protein